MINTPLPWQQIYVDGNLTFETQGVQIIIDEDQFELFNSKVLDEEKEFYVAIATQLERFLKDNNFETTSRRNLIFTDECISTIQFLFGRTNSTMVVTMRSSDVKKLPSDISFYIGLAKQYAIKKLIIHIASLHIIFGE